MTPLIDVLLVLLIIFMVITPVKPKGLEARVPQDAKVDLPQAVAERSVVVSVGKDAQVRINQEMVELEQLGPRLVEIFALRAERVCFVQGDGELEFQQVARVIDLARGAGIGQVGLLTRAF